MPTTRRNQSKSVADDPEFQLAVEAAVAAALDARDEVQETEEENDELFDGLVEVQDALIGILEESKPSKAVAENIETVIARIDELLGTEEDEEEDAA